MEAETLSKGAVAPSASTGRTGGQATAPRIVILGGGTGGTLLANRLRRAHGRREAGIAVVDRDDRRIYQPGQVPVAFGISQPKDIVRSRWCQLRAGVDFHETEIDHVDLEADQVPLAGGDVLEYDALVVATGARLAPGTTPGLSGPGWMEKVLAFYDLEGAAALSAALERFHKGRLVVGVVDMPIKMPIKCPVAPLELCLLADWYFTERRVRDRIEITFLSPLPSLFAAPIADASVERLFAHYRVGQETGFHTSEVDGVNGRIVEVDGREVRFDLAVVVPPFRGAAYVGRSPGLGNERDFIEVDTKTLQSPAHPNVFAIGDTADLPTSNTGSVPHFRGRGRPQHPNAPRRRAARRLLRRAWHRLHRDGLPQGDAARLQIHHPAPPRTVPGGCRPGRRHRRGAVLTDHARVTFGLRRG